MLKMVSSSAQTDISNTSRKDLPPSRKRLKNSLKGLSRNFLMTSRILSTDLTRITGTDNILKPLTPIIIPDRNVFHYTSMNKTAKSVLAAEILLNYDLKLEGFDEFFELFQEVQLLELNKELKIDPRQYAHAYDGNPKFNSAYIRLYQKKKIKAIYDKKLSINIHSSAEFPAP